MLEMEVSELIERLPDDSAFRALRRRADFYCAEAVTSFLQRIDDLRLYGPKRHFHLADFGLRAASRAGKRRERTLEVCALASRVWANYKQGMGDFSSARVGYLNARNFLRHGSSISSRVDLACRITSLYRAQRRFDLARTWANASRRIAGMSAHRGKAILFRAGAVADFFPEEAIVYYRRAFRLLRGSGTSLSFAAAQGLALNLIAARGSREEIEICVAAARSELEKCRSPIMTAHMSWLRGKFELSYGDAETAMESIRECSRLFQSVQLFPYAAISYLEQAEQSLALGRIAEASALVLEALPVLGALEWTGEELRASQILANGARSGVIASTAISAVRQRLLKAAQEL